MFKGLFMKYFLLILLCFSTQSFAQVSAGDKILASDFNNKKEKFTPLRVLAYKNADALNPGTYGLISFNQTNTESEDNFSAWDGSSFTVPIGKGGDYLIALSMTAKDSSVGFSAYFEVRMTVNSTSVAGSDLGGHGSWSTGTPYPSINFSIPLKLNAGDVLRIYGLQSAGSLRPFLADGRSFLKIQQLTQSD